MSCLFGIPFWPWGGLDMVESDVLERCPSGQVAWSAFGEKRAFAVSY